VVQRAFLLQKSNRLAEAIREMEKALQEKPRAPT